MPTVLMSVVGIKKINVVASSLVVWGQEKLWISLVLDNTGSMTQTSGGSNPVSKISALKTATHQLLTMLQGIVVNPGDVQVSIVPFARDVKIGTAQAAQTWLDWSDWIASSPKPSKSVGPGSNCPYTDGSNSFHCQSQSDQRQFERQHDPQQRNLFGLHLSQRHHARPLLQWLLEHHRIERQIIRIPGW